ncbi:MAG TPA: hypothetical protein VFK05_39100 [Polyangiaceae bacterium]|nr:hypothetical protein [Polyangiaceae bacterium]
MVRGATGVGFAGFLSLLSLATHAGASKPGQAFRMEYWADGACPDATEFARQIQTRAPRLRLAEGDEPALGFYAELIDHGHGASGRLTARSPDGREVVREVRGPTCADVSTALALIAALAADPNQPVDEQAPKATAAKKTPRTSSAEEALPHLDEPEAERRWTFGVGGGVGFESSIAPNPGYGLGVVFEAESHGNPGLRALFTLAAMRAVTSNTQTQGGNVSFDWVTFRLAVCPARWPEETPLFVRPCGFLDGGFLGGDVEHAGNSQAKTEPWFALGGFLRTEALVGEVVSFQLDGGVTVPLVRSSFSAGVGQPTAFEVPSSGFLGRIGVSYRFR